jgi:hypothetical protein
MYFVRRNQGNPEGQPLPTWLHYLGMACILAIIVVGRRIVRSANAKSTDKKQDSRSERKLIRTIWCVINISLVALGVREGYASLAPEQLRHVNPDAVFCSVILLTLPLFALFTVYYSVRQRNVDKLRRPSFDRNPLNCETVRSVGVVFATARRPDRGQGGFGQDLRRSRCVNQKGPETAFLDALHAFKAAGTKLPVNLVLVCEGEEEIGSTHFPEVVHQPKVTAALKKYVGVFIPEAGQDLDGGIQISLVHRPISSL